jgi:hypothetical protein
MGRSSKGLVCLLVCLFLAGCSQAVKSVNRILDPNSSEQVQTVRQEGAGEPAQGVCLLDPAAMIRQEAAPSSASCSPEKGPAVEVPETSHDFGKVTADGEVVHKFSVRNVGKVVLNIKKVLPG